MNCLIITPDRDSALHPGDWSGAFAPEAKRLTAALRTAGHSVTRMSVNCTDTITDRRRLLIGALPTAPLPDADRYGFIAVLCHGWRDGIQVGLTRITVGVLPLAHLCTADVRIALYACSTASDDDAGVPGGGEGSFADVLRDEAQRQIPDWSGWLDAHDRRGHTTRNPYVRRFYSNTAYMQEIGEPNPSRPVIDASGNTVWSPIGGSWVVSPESPVWPAWYDALHDSDDLLRFRYPLMTASEIHKTLTR